MLIEAFITVAIMGCNIDKDCARSSHTENIMANLEDKELNEKFCREFARKYIMEFKKAYPGGTVKRAVCGIHKELSARHDLYEAIKDE